MRKGPWLVRHRVEIHGTRYDVDRTHELRLRTELAQGTQQLQNWLARRPAA